MLNTKIYEDSVNKLEDLEKELCEKYSTIMYEKIMGELKGMGDSEYGGFSSGKLWKLQKKISPRISEPPSAMWFLMVRSLLRKKMLEKKP